MSFILAIERGNMIYALLSVIIILQCGIIWLLHMGVTALLESDDGIISEMNYLYGVENTPQFSEDSSAPAALPLQPPYESEP